MSVLGLDLGTSNAVIAVAQRGGVDILANEASSRLTATLVSFDEKQRYCGESAQAVQMSNLKNTVGNLKQLLGRQWNDPELQADLKHLGVCNEFTELPDGRVGVKVTYLGNPTVFSPEQLAGMLFAKLRETTEKETRVKVKDVVVSVPGWFNEAQRRALLDAVKLGGMECLKIVNDLTAISLSWGLYKVDLDEKIPTRVMFIDIGEHCMSVGITEFTKSQAKVISTAYDTKVGGGAVDFALASHFADEFLVKRKIDLRQHPKSWFRLLAAVGRVKKILNTNPSAPLNVECIYEEFDINSVITRDVYAELIKSVVANVPTALDLALARAGLTAADLHDIEIVGSASRTTLFQTAMATHLGRDLHQTLNAEEAVAKGCALQCAILSPHFRVREYHLVDVVDHPVTCAWATLNDPNDQVRRVTIFDQASAYPAAKNVNFHRAECKPFEVQITQDDRGHSSVISTVTIDSVPKPAEGPDADVRLKIRKNLNGIVEVVECDLVEKYEEAVPAAATPTTPATPAEGSPMDVDQKAAPEGEATPPPAAEAPKKKKVRYTSVPFKVKYNFGAPASLLQEWAKLEAEMSEATHIAIACANAKNAVETYVYDARDKLYANWAPYVVESDAAQFSTLLDQVGDWLYAEGEDETRPVYEQKLLSLRALGDPIDFRLSEHEARDATIAKFEQIMQDYQSRATDTSAKYDHIAPEEKQKILAEIEKHRSWFAPLQSRQAQLKLSDDPVFHNKDLTQRTNDLVRMADAILNKPKPKPKPAETPKPAAESTPTPEQNADASAQPTEPETNGTEMNTDAPAADPNSAQMDVD